MSLSRIYAVYVRYLMLLRDSPQRLFQIFVWGGLDVVLWGFITKYLNELGGASFNFVPALLGAIILLDFVSRVQQGTATPALEDIWSNNLLNYFASPLKIGEYVLGLVCASVTTTVVSLCVMMLIAYAFFGLSLFSLGVPLAAFLLVLFLFGITLGVIATGIVLRFGPSAEWFVWPMTVVLSPFMCVFYPLTVLPGWMQLIARLLPPSYVFEGMRSVLAGRGVSLPLLLTGLLLDIVYLVLAQLFFSYVYRRVVALGLLARYSAESL